MRGYRIFLTLPLYSTARARHPPGWHIAVLSLSHNKCDIVHNIQPRSIVVRKIVKARNNPSSFGRNPTRFLLLLQVPLISAVPPHKTQDHQECTLGSAGKYIRPPAWALRWFLFRAVPFRLDRSPPFCHFSAEVRNCEGIAACWLVSILEVLFNLRWLILGCKSCTL